MRKAFLLLMLVPGFILGACANTAAIAEQNYPIKIWAQNSKGTLQYVPDAHVRPYKEGKA